MESHLLQMRGLKQIIVRKGTSVIKVASFTDAWIETGLVDSNVAPAASRIFYRCVD